MKKILSMLSALTVTASSVTAVAACRGRDENEIVVQMNASWINAYGPAIEAINKSFEEQGLKFRARTQEMDIFDNYENIANRGVRDRNTPDIFMLGFDRYQGFKDQNNIKELSSEIKSILINDKTDEEHFGISVDNGRIEIDKNNSAASAWETTRIQEADGDYFGMVPASIENLIWIFDKNRLGIDDGKFVGSIVEESEVQSALDGDTTASLENLAKINTAKESTPVGYFKAVDGYYGGNAINGVLNKNIDYVKPVPGSSEAIVWQKSGIFPSRIHTDFDSIWENEKTADAFTVATNTLADLGFSYGQSIRASMFNQTTDDTLGVRMAENLRDGTTALSVLGPWDLLSYTNMMRQGNAEANLGIASISSMQITNNSDEGSLSGFAGGYGWAIRSTISEITNSTNKGTELTKAEAAMMVIKELAQPTYAAEMARADGKYSAYQANIDASIEYFESQPGMELFAQAIAEISKSYQEGGVSQRPNTALFDIYWEAWANSYRLAMNTNFTSKQQARERFNEQFLDLWTRAKEEYIWD